jgi:dolichol-phosphate mannosyltransferase
MYNEEAGAALCVQRVCQALDALPGRRTVMIAVEDGSRDGTAAVLDGLVARYPRLVVLAHARNGGYGAALQTGARHAAAQGFDYVLYMDSDLTNDPADIPRFVAHMDRGVDVIKATRYSGGGRVDGVPFRRWIVSAVGNAVARALFRLPVHDCTNGYRAVRAPLLAAMTLRETKFPVIMEELYWCAFTARTYAEVPVVLTNRAEALRPTSFQYQPSVFWRYLRYPLKAFFRVRPAGPAAP